MRTRSEIEAEIKALKSIAKDYDTDLQSSDTCVAAGAHDALVWVQGFGSSVAESLKEGRTP